eukprot:2742005-Heterocapsa_arctica.AAC.1
MTLIGNNRTGKRITVAMSFQPVQTKNVIIQELTATDNSMFQSSSADMRKAQEAGRMRECIPALRIKLGAKLWT